MKVNYGARLMGGLTLALCWDRVIFKINGLGTYGENGFNIKADLGILRVLVMMDRNSQGSEGEESENSFFGRDGSSSNEQPNQPRRNHSEDNSRWELRMRVNILDFDGDTLNFEGFIVWLVTVEEVFEFKEVLKNKRVSLIATKLRGRVSAWWQQLKLTRERFGKPRVTSWMKMKKLLRANFIPYNYEWLMYLQLQNMKQGTKSVEDYTTAFYQLIARNDIQDTDDQLSPQYGPIHPTQHYSTTYPSTPLAITYSAAPYPNAYSSTVHQEACPQPQSVPQILKSSNPRQQATIHDGRVTVQPVQERQSSFAAGEGHMSRQCPKPKRKRDATWFRDKVLLVEAHGSGKVLNEGELEFLADPGVVKAKTVLMANLSSYGSDVLFEVSHSENTHNDMLNQSVQEMSYSEQTHLVNYPENDITSDRNIIPYS
nr:reverse transcriptase domain-containing protein [Tanacetum cinerariifolium]